MSKTKFRIISISSKDAFYPNRKRFIGRTCTISKASGCSKDRLPPGFEEGWVSQISLVIKGMEDFPYDYVIFHKVKLLVI